MEFQPGQRVRCVIKSHWRFLGGCAPVSGPVFGQVCTVSHVFDGCAHHVWGWLSLVGFDPGSDFSARGFRPLSDGELEKLRQSIVEPPLRVRDLVELLP